MPQSLRSLQNDTEEVIFKSGDMAMSPLIQEINRLLQSDLDDVILNAGYQNALPALDEYRQQMEEYLDVLRDMIKTLGKGAQRLRRKQRQFEDMSAEADRSARQFLQEGQEELVRAAYARKRIMQLACEAYQEEADWQNARFLVLMDAKLRLEARLTEVAQRSAAMQMRETRDNGALLQAVA